MKDLSKRIISGTIGIILMVYVINKGGLTLAGSILLISLIGLKEFYRAISNIEIKPVEFIGYIGAIGVFISNINSSISFNFILVLIITALLISLIFIKDMSIKDLTITLFSVLYIPFSLFHIYSLDGSNYIWLIFIIAFGTDTCAYLVGNLLGKRKLAPELSPNKTIEGSIGGIVGSVVITLIYGFIMNIKPIWKLIILSIFASVIAQMGDLVASKVKRETGIKDYGFIMPGHGGVLDRFDSIILSAPLIYYYVSLF